MRSTEPPENLSKKKSTEGGEDAFGFAYDFNNLPRIVAVHTLDREDEVSKRKCTSVEIFHHERLDDESNYAPYPWPNATSHTRREDAFDYEYNYDNETLDASYHEGESLRLSPERGWSPPRQQQPRRRMKSNRFERTDKVRICKQNRDTLPSHQNYKVYLQKGDKLFKEWFENENNKLLNDRAFRDANHYSPSPNEFLEIRPEKTRESKKMSKKDESYYQIINQTKGCREEKARGF